MNEVDEKSNYKNEKESEVSNSTGIDINLSQTNNMYKIVVENDNLFDIKNKKLLRMKYLII